MTRSLPVFQVSELCAPCGGACCKRCPGGTSPEDWGAPDRAAMTERLRAAFATGRWAVDRWYGEDWRSEEALRDDVLFVRAAEKGSESASYVYDELEGDDYDGDIISRMVARMSPPSHPCTFHGPTGCELTFEARPIECRALEPKPVPAGKRGHPCEAHAGGKRERAIEWAPYQDLLRRVAG